MLVIVLISLAFSTCQMSGGIRQAIGPARARLLEYIEDVPVHTLTIDPSQPKEEQLNSLRTEKSNLVILKTRIQKAIDLLFRKDAEWNKLIEQLEGEVLNAETQRYKEAVVAEDGFFKSIFKGEEKIIDLDSWLEEIDQAMEKIERPNTVSNHLLMQGLAPNLVNPAPNLGGAPNPVMQSTMLNNTFQTNASSASSMSMRLPKLQLPQYHGDPCRWKEFWDVYEVSVHQQPNIPDAVKFSYLQSVLKGTAQSAIAGIAVSNENYEQAISILRERFGDLNVIKQSLYAKLREIGLQKSLPLRQILETTESVLRQLHALGEETNHPYLVQLILQVLPTNILIELERMKRSNDEWEMSNLLTALWQVVKSQDRVRRLRGDDNKHMQGTSSKAGPHFPQIRQTNRYYTQSRLQNYNRFAQNSNRSPQNQNLQSTVGSFATNMTSQRSQTSEQKTQQSTRQMTGKFRCIFCSQSHRSEDCQEYPSVKERHKKLFKDQRCFRCFKLNHTIQECPMPRRECIYCKDTRHNRVLCLKKTPQQPKFVKTAVGMVEENEDMMDNKDERLDEEFEEMKIQDEGDNEEYDMDGEIDADDEQYNYDDEEEIIGANIAVTNSKNEATVLLSAEITVKNPETGQSCNVVAVFDCACQRCFFASKKANELQLPVNKEMLQLQTFAAKKPTKVQSAQAVIELCCKDGSSFKLPVKVLPHLIGKIEKFPLSETDSQFLHENKITSLKNVQVSNKAITVVPDLVIGIDYMFDLLLPERQIKLPSGLHVLSSKLGYLLGGKTKIAKTPSNLPIATNIVKVDHSIQQDIENLWSLENIGIKDCPIIKEDEYAVEQFERSIGLQDKGKEDNNFHYEVGWPWRPDAFNTPLPDNKALAYKRLQSNCKRLFKEPDLLMKYSAIVDDQLNKGIIEEVKEETTRNPLNYLPHHSVITPLKTTTKVRMVFDGSAKSDKTTKSLNERLLQGPNLLPDLCSILLRIRLYVILLISDIEKAFLQVGLKESDRDVTRFYWLIDSTIHTLHNNVCTYRFRRIPFGIISSPFLLCNTIKYHLIRTNSEIADKVLENIYVDNVIVGVTNKEEALQFFQEAKHLFTKAGMNLREWCSNSKEFLQTLPVHEKPSSPSNKIKILGLSWYVNTDEIELNGPKLPTTNENLTKRTILGIVSSIFDPLGLISPITLIGKLFVMQLWTEHLNWDDKLSKEKIKQWLPIQQKLREVKGVRVPRKISQHTKTPEYLLHAFVDTSLKAYAVAIYLHSHTEDHIDINLIFAKSRLAPKKQVTIPRLELLAMTIGTRALMFAKNSLKLKFTKVILWSDSQACLHWLKSKKLHSTFVENRLRELRNYTNIEFRYVPTDQNPADIATRGCTVAALQANQSWWVGPHWLKVQPYPTWNMETVSSDLLHLIASEEKEPKMVFQASSVTQSPNLRRNDIDFIPITRVNSDIKLYRIIAYVFRLIHTLIGLKLTPTKQPIFQQSFPQGYPTLKSPLLSKEIVGAKHWLCKKIQEQFYAKLIKDVQSKKKNQLKNQLGVQLAPDGLLRCFGRLGNALLSYESKHPILLPAKHPFTTLLIRSIHERNQHIGPTHTLTCIREEFWIPKVRKTLNSYIANCTTCRRQKGKEFRLPPMQQLPAHRVQGLRPFAVVGIDFAGPLWVKTESGKTKTYVCLFSCTSTRALHLELVPNLSARSFLNCLCRFIARRGKPNMIISDNASQIKLTEAMLTTNWIAPPYMTDNEVYNYCASTGINWHFIPAFSPWYGGFYERMVQLIKNCLKRTIGKKLLTYEQLETTLIETEAIINSRPLLFSGNDIQANVLRPIDFVLPGKTVAKLGIPITATPDERNDPTYNPNRPTSKDELLLYWEEMNKIIDEFWNIWLKEYVTNLREAHQKEHRTSKDSVYREPVLDEIVLIKQPTQPRGIWSLGKIVQLNRSNDRYVRTVKLVLPNKRIQTKPINLIFPIELTPTSFNSFDQSITCPNQRFKQGTQSPQLHSDSPITDVVHTSPIPIPTPIHQYNLRPRKLPIAPVITLMIFFLMIHTTTAKLTSVSAVFLPIFMHSIVQANRCTLPEQDLVLLQTEKCVQSGIGIFRVKVNQERCWLLQKCSKLEHLGGYGNCMPKCKCPKWASDCIHLNAESKPPKTPHNTLEILETVKPNFCSLTPDPRCSKTPKPVTLTQIELFDDTLHFVDELDIEFITPEKEQYLCNGVGKTTGTDLYCKTHACEKDATKICWYLTSEFAYLVIEDGKIPIKAWGSIETEIYPSKGIHKLAPSCFECQLSCLQGGVQISLPSGINFLEICSQPICYSMSFPEQELTILFPPEINLHSHDFDVKIWKAGYLIKNMGITCSATPFCEMLQCYFCLTRLANPQCTPNSVLLVLFVILSFGSITLYWAVKGLKILFYIFHYLILTLRGTCHLCRYLYQTGLSFRRTHSDQILPIKQPPTIKKTPRVKFLPISGVVFSTCFLLTLFPSIYACADSTTLNAKSSSCVSKGKNVECLISDTTTLSLAPQGQTVCLIIRNDEDVPIGTLSIKVQKLSLLCQKESWYFSRSFKMKIRSIKRCDGAGTCKDKKCGEITTTSKIEEFSDDANDAPGATFCLESCGGLLGCGCVLPSYACLFYRQYAVALTPAIFEVFSCPMWVFSVEADMEITTTNRSEKHTFKLSPGIKKVWKNVQLTLASVTQPPSPILNTKFITQGSVTMLTDPCNQGQPVPATIGAMQCKDKKAADTFQCAVPDGQCRCQAQGSKVGCQCAEHDLDKHFDNNNDKLLPLEIQGITIASKGDVIEAQYNSETALQLQITLQSFKLVASLQKNKCQVKNNGISGCYSCLTGAKLIYACSTDYGTAIAYISCGRIASFSVLCSDKGTSGTATLHFTKANIHTNCQVTCPGGTTTFKITTTLHYVEKTLFTNNTNIVPKQGKKKPGDHDIDFGALFSFLTNNWISSILLIFGILLALLVVAPLLPKIAFLPSLLLKKLYRRYFN